MQTPSVATPFVFNNVSQISFYIPKSGYIILFRLSDSMYKFSYTTSLTLEQMIFHKFIKIQFSNSFNGDTYELLEEDMNYIQNENFPSNAIEVECLEG